MTPAQTQYFVNDLYKLWINASTFVTYLRESTIPCRPGLLAGAVRRRDEYWKVYELVRSTSRLWPDESVVKGLAA